MIALGVATEAIATGVDFGVTSIIGEDGACRPDATIRRKRSRATVPRVSSLICSDNTVAALLVTNTASSARFREISSAIPIVRSSWSARAAVRCR